MVCWRNLSIIVVLILHDDCQEAHGLAVEGLHAVGQAGVEVDAVAWGQGEFLAADAQEQGTFDDEVELLSGMRVVVHGAVVGLYGHDEGVGLAVLESGSQRLVLVGLGALHADALAGTRQEVGAHLGFFAEHQRVEGNVVVACYLLEHAHGDVVFARLGAFVFVLVDAAFVGNVVGSQFHGVAQSAQALGYLFNLFVHTVI